MAKPMQPPTVQPKRPATGKGVVTKVPHEGVTGPDKSIVVTGKG